MATVDGITAAKAQEIEDASVVSGYVDGNGDLILTQAGGGIINAGPVTNFAALSAHEADTSSHGATGAVVGTTNTQTLSGKTLTSPVINNGTLVTPTIASFANAAHNHNDTAGSGGNISLSDNGITGRSALHFGTAYVTPAVGGKASVPHGAPFTPDQIVAVASDNDSAVQTRKGIVCNVLSDGIGASNFDVRVYRNDDASSIETALRINFICFKA